MARFFPLLRCPRRLPLVVLVLHSVRGAPLPHTRDVSSWLTQERKLDANLKSPYKRDLDGSDGQTTNVSILILIASFLALSLAWLVGIEGVRRAVNWIKAHSRRSTNLKQDGFNTLNSTISAQDEMHHREVQENEARPVSAQGRALESRGDRENKQRVPSLRLAESAPEITITETSDADEKFPHDAPNIPITSPPVPPIPDSSSDLVGAPEISAAPSSPLPLLQTESSLPSSSDAPIRPMSPSHQENLSHNTPDVAQEAMTPKASLRLEPIRTSLIPSTSPRQSMDIGSIMSDRSPSLAEFPIPPPRSLTPFLTTRSLTTGDLGDSRNLRSPTSPENSYPHVILEEGPPPPDPDQGLTIEDPPNTAGTRPPTYYGHTPSTASFSTLPMYPGGDDDDDGASQCSRAPTYRSTVSASRVSRTPRALPPPPVPPVPKNLSHKH